MAELNIESLRLRAKLNINDNLFSKDELKKIFIFNYKDTFGTGKVMSLNNNQTYQCFRNAAFYLLMRYQKVIWNLIDTLPTVANFAEIVSDVDKNKYLIVQTLIELMDDTIINRLMSDEKDNTIEKRRTSFLDNRLENFKTDDHLKYSNLGLLTTYRDAYLTQLASTLVMEKEEVELWGNGGISSEVVEFILANIFNNNTKFKTLSKFTDINETEFGDSNPDYVLFKFGDTAVSDIFGSINDKKLLTSSTGERYKLVGLLYDCPNGIAHQITSLCYGNQCLDNDASGYIKHNFFDDQKMLPNKTLNPANFRPRVDTGLQWACKNGGIIAQLVLYEKVSAVEQLDVEIKTYLGSKTLKYDSLVIHGGGKNDEYYKLKYHKYKMKYLKLKNN